LGEYTESGSPLIGKAAIAENVAHLIAIGGEAVYDSTVKTVKVLGLDDTHMIAVYQDYEANTGYAIVGTVTSGNVINYGSPASFAEHELFAGYSISKLSDTQIVSAY